MVASFLIVVLLVALQSMRVSDLPLLSSEKETVRAETGQNVTLNCEAPNVRVTESDGVHWTRPDLEKPKYVFFYRDNQPDTDLQEPRYQTRAQLADPDLKHGNLGLVLRNVSRDDSGTYECRVIRGGGGRSDRGLFDEPPIRTVQLIVTDPEKPNLGLIVSLSVAAVFLLVVPGVAYGYKKWKDLDKAETMTEMTDVS